jgi:hypothetical protein
VILLIAGCAQCPFIASISVPSAGVFAKHVQQMRCLQAAFAQTRTDMTDDTHPPMSHKIDKHALIFPCVALQSGLTPYMQNAL